MMKTINLPVEDSTSGMRGHFEYCDNQIMLAERVDSIQPCHSCANYKNFPILAPFERITN